MRIEDIGPVVDSFLSRIVYAPPMVAAGNAGVQSAHSIGTGQAVDLSNWAVVAALTIASYFLRRMIAQIDGHGKRIGKLENRMTASETHQEDCTWNSGGRRPYDPDSRNGQ